MKISSTEARDNLPALIKRAEAGETIELTTYGRPKAVIISHERYERLSRDLFSDTGE